MTSNTVLNALDKYADTITQAAIAIQEARLKYNGAVHAGTQDEQAAARMVYAGCVRVQHDCLLVDITNLNAAMMESPATITR